jgi:hypothetical protein
VPQEECARLYEDVRYVKVADKTQITKLNGYGDNGQRKVWSSGGSTHCTCQLTSSIEVCPWVWFPMTAHTSRKVHMCFLQGTLRCAVGHVTSVHAIHVSCIVLGTLTTTMTWRTSFFVVQFNGFMSLTGYFDVTYIINITKTTYSCQFEYVFGNQYVCKTWQSFRILWPLCP